MNETYQEVPYILLDGVIRKHHTATPNASFLFCPIPPPSGEPDMDKRQICLLEMFGYVDGTDNDTRYVLGVFIDERFKQGRKRSEHLNAFVREMWEDLKPYAERLP